MTSQGETHFSRAFPPTSGLIFGGICKKNYFVRSGSEGAETPAYPSYVEMQGVGNMGGAGRLTTLQGFTDDNEQPTVSFNAFKF